MNPEDRLLADENYLLLNTSFYRTAPYEHFRQKIVQLIFTAARRDELDRAFQEGGLKFGGVALQPNSAGLWRDAEQHEQFVAVESEILLHHLGEALLRLYLAHEPIPACPWLELARLRNFRDFKKLLDTRFIAAEQDVHLADVANVFFGARSRDELFGDQKEPSHEGWLEGARNIEGFLWFFAKHILQYANLYNAAKHGFAVKGRHSSSALFAPGEAPIFEVSGVSVEYLEIRQDKEGRHWNRTTTWIQINRSLTLMWIACRLMEALWSVARRRYLDAPLTHIDLFTDTKFIEVYKHKEWDQGLSPQSVSAMLQYYLQEE